MSSSQSQSQTQTQSRFKGTVMPISLFVPDAVLNELGSRPFARSTTPRDASSLELPTRSKGKSKSNTHDESLRQGQRNANTFKVCHALIDDIRAEEVKKAGKATTRTDLRRSWVDAGTIILDRLVKSHGPAPQRRVIPTSKDCQSVNVNDRYDEIYAHSAGELIPIGVIENGAELLRLADKELKNPTNGQITYQRCTKMDGFTRKADGQPFYKDYDDFKSAVSELLETYAIPYKDVTGRDLDAYLETSIGAEETELQAGITQRSLDTQTAAESAEPAQPPTATTASDYAATRAERVRAKNTGGSSAGGSSPPTQGSKTSSTEERFRKMMDKFSRKRG